MLYLLWPEVVGLEVQAGKVGAAIVHEPDGHGQRRQQISDVRGNDLSSIPIEPMVPLREHWIRACHKLHARVPAVPESLVELMKLHGDEVTECITLQLGQSSLGQLMLDEQPVKPTVLRQASVAQECAHQNLLLPTRQYVWS
jgi:hypothetical protein